MSAIDAKDFEQDLCNDDYIGCIPSFSHGGSQCSESDNTSGPQQFSLTDFSDSSQSANQLSEKKVGRKTDQDTLTMRLFLSIIGQRVTRHPKKEHLRIQFYRGLVTCLTNLREGGSQTQRINKCFSENDEMYQRELEALKLFYMENMREIDQVIEAFPSPQEAVIPFSSFSTKFFQAVLCSPALQQCFRLYSRFLFADPSPDVMDKRLKIVCCPAALHTIDCYDKWGILEEFYVNKLFKNAMPGGARHE